MNRGRLEEGKWELHPFVSIFSPIFVLLDGCSPFTSVRQRRTIARSKTCLSVSYSLPVSLLFILLYHSAMKAAANTHTHLPFTHIRTHSHTGTLKDQWLCILHESSTSEGLSAFFILQLTAEMMRSKLVLALKGCFLSLLQKLQFMAKEGVYCNFKHQYEIQ